MQDVANSIGEAINLSDTELNRLALLINLHDIGKIKIPESVLNKNKTLTNLEWDLMKKHSEIGFRIARATEGFAHVAEDILAHHECWNGTGYPQGLKGKDIPLLARIAAIVDAYEVMSYASPYKEVMGKEVIITEFKNCAGNQFDPELIEVFLHLLENNLIE